MRIYRVLLFIALAAAAVIALPALAQVFPANMLTIVVPFPAGGQSDQLARTVQQDLSKNIGKPAVVVNIGGAGGALGIQQVLKTPVDGRALLLASPSDLVLAPLAMMSVKHKPDEFRLAGVLIKSPLVLLTRPTMSAKNLKELLEEAKAPGAKGLSYGSPGYGSVYHLAGEAFAKKVGIEMLHVPYKGGAPMLQDLMGNTIDVVFLPMSGSVPALIREGKVKAYAITAGRKHPMFPELPAIAADPAFEGVDFNVWAGLLVPKSTPDEIYQKLNTAINASLANPAVRESFESTGNQVGEQMSPDALSKYYGAEVKRYTDLAKALKVVPQ